MSIKKRRKNLNTSLPFEKVKKKEKITNKINGKKQTSEEKSIILKKQRKIMELKADSLRSIHLTNF